MRAGKAPGLQVFRNIIKQRKTAARQAAHKRSANTGFTETKMIRYSVSNTRQAMTAQAKAFSRNSNKPRQNRIPVSTNPAQKIRRIWTSTYINAPGKIPLHTNNLYKLVLLPAKMRNKNARIKSIHGKKSVFTGFSRRSRIHRMASCFRLENIKITS